MNSIKLVFCKHNLSIMHNLIKYLDKDKFLGVEYIQNKYELFVDYSSLSQGDTYKFFCLLSKLIVQFYKCKLVTQHIKLTGKMSALFNKLIVNYESDLDINYIAPRLMFYSSLNVQSFWVFKCKVISEKLCNIVSIVNNNLTYLNNNCVANDFIAFLLQGINCTNYIKVKYNDGKYVIKNINASTITESEEDLIYNIILLMPHKIEIYCCNNLSGNAISNLYQLFGNKISLHT